VQSAPEVAERRGAVAGRWLRTVAACAVLVLFGLLQGLTGAFQFSRTVAGLPLAAAGFAIMIGVSCWLSGWGMGAAGGAFATAAGWVSGAFAMALPDGNGSVVITNTAAGEVFLYGGALCAAIGVGVCLSGSGRGPGRLAPDLVSERPPRSGRGPSPGRSR
jgi:hypothetical protein